MAGDIWKKAETDLLVPTVSGLSDSVIWDHSSRVARIAETIALLPELKDQAVDRVALTAACLYHDAGWLLQYRAGKMGTGELLIRPTTQAQRDLAADWVKSQLVEVLPSHSLERVVLAVRCCNDRRTRVVESQILAEAESLEEIGPQAIPLLIRRQIIAEGRTLGAWIAAWERQEEYHYWQTRIKESFRFAPIRMLAEERYEAMRRFMCDLRVSVRQEDLSCLRAQQEPRVDVVQPVS